MCGSAIRSGACFDIAFVAFICRAPYTLTINKILFSILHTHTLAASTLTLAGCSHRSQANVVWSFPPELSHPMAKCQFCEQNWISTNNSLWQYSTNPIHLETERTRLLSFSCIGSNATFQFMCVRQCTASQVTEERDIWYYFWFRMHIAVRSLLLFSLNPNGLHITSHRISQPKCFEFHAPTSSPVRV